MILPRYALFAAFLASAGVPIYIYAPKFFADTYGVGIGAIGVTLFVLRLLDFVQDPVLGWIVGRIGARRQIAAIGGALGMIVGMFGLFTVVPPVHPLAWMAINLTVLFTSFSFLSILFYARGVAQAQSMGPGGHIRLGGWREAGSLAGISIFCVVPVVLIGAGWASPFTGFAVIFAALGVAAILAMHRNWPGLMSVSDDGFAHLLSCPDIRRLLTIGLLNAAPVAVTSTLFLFFVESRLGAPELAGPLLLAFFMAAAISTPGWSRLARQFNPEHVLAAGMMLAIATFVWAFSLEAGDTTAFLIICLLSGAALGADMTLLPAMMSQSVAESGGNSGQAFGLWNFAAKASLALAAIAVLPALEASGFRTGASNDPAALVRLSILYALVPSFLKVTALSLLLFTRSKVSQSC